MCFLVPPIHYFNCQKGQLRSNKDGRFGKLPAHRKFAKYAKPQNMDVLNRAWQRRLALKKAF
jgi:hypothetical protein